MSLLQGIQVRHDSSVVFEAGAATTPQVRAAIQSKLTSLGPESRVFPIEVDPPMIGILFCSDRMQIVLLRNVSEEGVLFDFLASVPFATAILNQFLANPHGAITVADKHGIVRFISPPHERAMGLKPGEATGKPMSEVVPGSRLSHVIASGRPEIADVQRLQGVHRIVNRIPIWQGGEIVGAVGRVLLRAEAVQSLSAELVRLESEVKRYQQRLDCIEAKYSPLRHLLGESPAMQQLKEKIRRLADLDVPVLILGESGTGKELVAKALHGLSGREHKALISLNLAALPTTLVEAELFGYASGAFTGGAKEGRPGKFELANESTLFLDEVGDIPMDIQVKLLRVLEDQVVERLGAHSPQRVSFRLVSATHRSVEQLLESQQFRLDLYYRLAGVSLRVPALRERLEDIPPLLSHFVHGFCTRNSLPTPGIHEEVSSYLAQQNWPGNVRQLRQSVEEALVFAGGKTLTPSHFQLKSYLQPMRVEPALAPTQTAPMREHMIRAARLAVEAHGGNKNKAASALGISRSHLYKLLSIKPS